MNGSPKRGPKHRGDSGFQAMKNKCKSVRILGVKSDCLVPDISDESKKGFTTTKGGYVEHYRPADKYSKLTRHGSIHRWSLEVFLGRNLGENLQASHLCGNPSCINKDHLTEESAFDNSSRKGCFDFVYSKETGETYQGFCNHQPPCITIKQVTEVTKI